MRRADPAGQGERSGFSVELGTELLVDDRSEKRTRRGEGDAR